MRFAYYEDGKKEIVSMRKVYRMFTVNVDASQKEQGTTFKSWLNEMIKYQILNILF